MKSILEPKSFDAPEMMMVCRSGGGGGEERELSFDDGSSESVVSKTVSLQRGNSGFGFSVKEVSKSLFLCFLLSPFFFPPSFLPSFLCFSAYSLTIFHSSRTPVQAAQYYA